LDWALLPVSLPSFWVAITFVTCLHCIAKLLLHLNLLGLELGPKTSTLKTVAVCFSETFIFMGLHSVISQKSTGRSVELNSYSLPFYGSHPRSCLPVFMKNIWNTKNWLELFSNRICHRGSKIFQKCGIHPQSFRHQFPYWGPIILGWPVNLSVILLFTCSVSYFVFICGFMER
jgi:hypothetical protein